MGLTQVSTDGVKNDAINTAKINNGSIQSEDIADNQIITTKILDGAVSLAKLPHGDTNNNGKFLRANNGADPSFETITGTTINNNADNRVITGSGTANTLNGESTLTFDGSSMVLGSNSSASAGATDLIIGANTSAHGLTIYSGYLDESTINFGDANGTGSTSRIGRIAYDHDGNKMIFTVNDAERLRITSGGMVNINDTSNTAVKLYVTDTNPVIASFHHSDGGTNDQARISLGALANNPPYNRGINLIAENNGAGHDFVVACSPSHSGGPAEKIRVKSSGGITFNGDTATANALDDYEEGTWTPTMLDGNGSNYVISPNTAQCHYTKIGRMVYCFYNITNNENGSKTGNLYFPVSCLPFTPSPAVQASGTFFVDHGGPRTGLGDIIGGNHNVGTGAVYFTQPTRKNNGDTQSTANNRYLAHGQWSYGRPIYGEFSYKVA